MNWEALGAAAELVAAIGGVTAVVYLAVQIRINTKAVRSATIDSWVTAVSLGNEAMATTDEFISIAIEDYDSLDDQQRRLLNRALAQMYNALEALYFHHSNGVVDDQFFEAKMLTVRHALQKPGILAWWSSRGKSLFDPRFVGYVDSLLSE
jgi:hypothetical protein